MQAIKHLFRNNEIWLLTAIITGFGLLYISRLTFSGLWYDEAIEYYYSRYMSGVVPVSVINPMNLPGNNMYERICMTFQPPLYNILMYLWLLICDNESGFRLAGVLTTFIGALGLYLAIRRHAGNKWGAAGLCIYLSTAVVVYYALECGEYNLMMCMECWTLYFFVVCSDPRKDQTRWSALIGFFLFIALSLYSQYGAAFFAIAVSISLCIIYIKSKKYTSLKRFLIVGIATFVFTIIPLLIFFLRIQIVNQGTSTIDHSFVFVGSFLGGIPYSFLKSIYEQVVWFFSSALIWGWRSLYIMISTVFIVSSFTILSIFLKQKSHMLMPSIMACILCYTLFFVLSACSLYSYNSWDGRLGCYNITHQTRYVLFIVPLFVFTIIVGMINIYQNAKKWKYHRIIKGGVYLILLIFITNVIWSLYKGKIKSDDREATIEWINRKDFSNKVVVQEWVSPTFMYYVQHSPIYKDVRDNIILTRHDMRIPEKIEPHLRELGVIDLPRFYFIGNSTAEGMDNGEGIQIIYDIFIKEGYDVQTIREGTTSMLYISK
jgi:hypothetical protein